MAIPARGVAGPTGTFRVLENTPSLPFTFGAAKEWASESALRNPILSTAITR